MSNIGVAVGISGLAYDADQDILYGTDGVFFYGTNGIYTSSPLINSLFKIDRATGVAILIASTGVSNLWGLAYDPRSHQLFATTSDKPDPSLYTINPATGQATLIGSLGLPSGVTATRELAFDPVRNILFLGTEGV